MLQELRGCGDHAMRIPVCGLTDDTVEIELAAPLRVVLHGLPKGGN